MSQDPQASPELLTLRNQIDSLDRQLLELVNQRAHVAEQVGELKKKEGSAFFRPDRVAQVIEKIQAANPGYRPWFVPFFRPGSAEVERLRRAIGDQSDDLGAAADPLEGLAQDRPGHVSVDPPGVAGISGQLEPASCRHPGSDVLARTVHSRLITCARSAGCQPPSRMELVSADSTCCTRVDGRSSGSRTASRSSTRGMMRPKSNLSASCPWARRQARSRSSSMVSSTGPSVRWRPCWRCSPTYAGAKPGRWPAQLLWFWWPAGCGLGALMI